MRKMKVTLEYPSFSIVWANFIRQPLNQINVMQHPSAEKHAQSRNYKAPEQEHKVRNNGWRALREDHGADQSRHHQQHQQKDIYHHDEGLVFVCAKHALHNQYPRGI